MGRKTLLQSTGKKTSSKKKEEEEKKKVGGAKKAASSKSKATTTKPKKTKAAAAKPKKTKKSTAQKTTSTKAKKTTKGKSPGKRTKKPTLKELLFKKFDSAMPESAQKKPFGEKTPEKLPEAPPFISAGSKEEAERMRKLLFKQFDLYETPAAEKPAPKPAKPAAQKKQPSIQELLFKKFDSAMPESPPKNPFGKMTPEKLPEAPPFISADSKEESERMKKLLFKKFDLAETRAARETEAAKPEGPPGATPSQPKETFREEGPPPSPPDTSGPMSKGLIWGIGLAAALIALLVWASASNTDNFYLKPTDQGIQIWRGKFAPTGIEKVVTIEGMKAPKPMKQVYSKQEIFPLVFDYFRSKADTALAAENGPDFAKIKTHLHQALSYAPTQAQRRQIESRLRDIDFMILFHRAEVAMSKGSEDSRKDAMAYLDRASTLAASEYQKELIEEARNAVAKAGTK